MQYDRETFKQQNYSIGRRFDALLQHRVAHHRKFLEVRDAIHSFLVRPEFGRPCGRQLRGDEIHCDEDWSD